jgi:2-hydroxycyclohexanecarboxyl-CoA dehydrogenase
MSRLMPCESPNVVFGTLGAMQNQSDLTGQVALVTGGTAGIGKSAAMALARRGASVTLLARDAQRWLAVVAEIEKLGNRAAFQPADLASFDEVQAAVEATVEEFGRLDILVASGGWGMSETPARLFHEIDPALYPNYTMTHLFSRLHAVRAVLDPMMAASKGSIVLVTTDSARTPTPGESLIGGSAAALLFLVRALGRELARHHIRINAVATTLTRDTDWYDWYQEHRESDAVLVRAFRKLEEAAVLGLASPDEIAETIVHLASGASAHITGATISVNGGASFPA